MIKNILNKILHYFKKIIIAVFCKDSYAKAKFKRIYAENKWKSTESVSGVGSELRNTVEIRKQLPEFLKKLKVKTLLDAPCGDFNWMNHVKLPKVNYIGGDIVAEIIKTNNVKFSDKTKSFIILDITKDTLPSADIMLNRDCLVHLSFQDINKFLINLKNSKIKYILTTTFTKHTQNKDIITGSWRPLNLALSPFLFTKPLLVIDEKCQENQGLFADKSLALYNVQDLPAKLTGY